MPIEPMTRAMNPVAFKVLLDRLAAELVRHIGIEPLRDPKRPDISIQKWQRQWRRLAPDRACAVLEPREEGLLDPLEVLDPGLESRSDFA